MRKSGRCMTSLASTRLARPVRRDRVVAAVITCRRKIFILILADSIMAAEERAALVAALVFAIYSANFSAGVGRRRAVVTRLRPGPIWSIRSTFLLRKRCAGPSRKSRSRGSMFALIAMVRALWATNRLAPNAMAADEPLRLAGR